MNFSQWIEVKRIVCSSTTVKFCTTITDASLDYVIETCMRKYISIVPVCNWYSTNNETNYSPHLLLYAIEYRDYLQQDILISAIDRLENHSNVLQTNIDGIKRLNLALLSSNESIWGHHAHGFYYTIRAVKSDKSCYSFCNFSAEKQDSFMRTCSQVEEWDGCHVMVVWIDIVQALSTILATVDHS